MQASPAEYNSALRPTRRSAAGKLRCWGGFICRKEACGAFYTAGGIVARPGGGVLAVGYWFWLKMCFLGDAHAGVSCRLQVGAPCNSALRPTRRSAQGVRGLCS